MAEFREATVRTGAQQPVSRWGAVIIVALWMIGIALVVRWLVFSA
jgi:hypothetical protein